MVKGIAFYALYKSRMLIIPCKADDFCLFIVQPDENLNKWRPLYLSNIHQKRAIKLYQYDLIEISSSIVLNTDLFELLLLLLLSSSLNYKMS